MKLSVVICSHNPREDYLRRTLDALQRQTLPKDEWELLIIDNASEQPLAGRWDPSWHPRGRIVREETLGLTPARLRGIKESAGELLVFVDDDNVLPPEYLVQAARIAAQYPFLGAWGGGCVPEFECEPPDWIAPYLGNLTILDTRRASWTNQYFDYRCTPIGAGLCLRRCVANKYRQIIAARTGSLQLDRIGDRLTSCGDHDMAYCAIDIGLGVGLFPELKPTHLIPSSRLEKSYILKLLEADAYSSYALKKIRGFPTESVPTLGNVNLHQTATQVVKGCLSIIKRSLFKSKRQPDFRHLANEARAKGSRKAAAEIKL